MTMQEQRAKAKLLRLAWMAVELIQVQQKSWLLGFFAFIPEYPKQQETLLKELNSVQDLTVLDTDKTTVSVKTLTLIGKFSVFIMHVIIFSRYQQLLTVVDMAILKWDVFMKYECRLMSTSFVVVWQKPIHETTILFDEKFLLRELFLNSEENWQVAVNDLDPLPEDKPVLSQPNDYFSTINVLLDKKVIVDILDSNITDRQNQYTGCGYRLDRYIPSIQT